MSSIPLGGIGADTVSDFAEDVTESGGTVEIADLPCARGNAMLLHNLVGNAVKYRRPEVPPHIEVLCEMDAGEGQCRVSVTDNGIGFDPAAADRLFGPFERLVPRSQFLARAWACPRQRRSSSCTAARSAPRTSWASARPSP